MIVAALLIGACSSEPDTEVPPLPKETAESANTLMAGAEEAARSAASRSEPKSSPTGSSNDSNEVTR
jgi:hypothetical protein